MTYFLVLLFALLIGVVAGLRALTAPAVVAWAGALGWINLDGTWAQWVAHPITVAVLTILALGELVTDQLPRTPSRRVPMQFGARLVTGAFAGAVLATGAVLNPTAWVIVGAIGAALDRRRARHARRCRGAQAARRGQRWTRPAGRAGRGCHRDRRRIRGRRARSGHLNGNCGTEIRRDHRRRRPGGAATGGQADRRRADRRGDRTQAGRRHLRQLRLHPDQDAGRQRPRRAHGPPRRRVRRRHRRCHRRHDRRSRRARTRSCSTTAHGRRVMARGHGQLHPDPRARAFRGPAHHPGRRPGSAGRQRSSSTSAAGRWCRTCRGWPTSTT